MLIIVREGRELQLSRRDLTEKLKCMLVCLFPKQFVSYRWMQKHILRSVMHYLFYCHINSMHETPLFGERQIGRVADLMQTTGLQWH